MSEEKVTFNFLCSCGFCKKYENLSADKFEKISVEEDDWYSEWSGLPKKIIEKYVYPPDVMKSVDLERRKLKNVSLKEILKASLKCPQNRDRTLRLEFAQTPIPDGNKENMREILP